MVAFDLIYKEIGEFGRYQQYIVFSASYTGIYDGLLFINSIFVLAIPDHRCAIPGLVNDTFAVQDGYHNMLINQTIPLSSDPDLTYDKCHVFSVSSDGDTIRQKCSQWVYDKSIWESTLAAKMNMVCDRAIMKSNAQMMFFGGLLTGSFITGMISDRFGRKRCMCVSSLFYWIAAMGIAWTPSYPVYMLLIFSVGFFAVGNFMPAFVLSMEFVGPSWRRFAGQVGSFAWLGGNLVLAGLGYAIRDWQTLQIVCASSGILFQLYWFIFPESARWLYSQGRKEESKKIIIKAARMNKVTLPSGFLDKVLSADETVPQGRIWQMFSTRVLAIRTMIIFFNWLVVCLAYYGLALNSGDIGGDIFLNFFLQALMDLPASLIVILLLDKTGRVPMLVTSMIVGGLGCLSTLFTIVYGGEDLQILTTVLAMLGKVGASVGFSVCYVYSAEVFPTVIRNAGMGSSSCMARVGGMLAPYIADLDRLIGGRFGKASPQLVFGVLSITAGLLAMRLPETYNKSLPETIEDAKNFGRGDDKPEETVTHINKAFDDTDNKTRL